jgi:phosphoglucosamine mutase
MGLIAWDMIQKDRLQQNTLVATVMSNIGLELAMTEMGGRLVRTQVGDRYVVECMRKDGYNFGGEQSGHLIFLDQNTSGDGVLSGLQVMRVMMETGKPLSELAARVTKFPQVQKNIEVAEKRDLDSDTQMRTVLKHAEGMLGGRGRVLVRYSGTQSVCRIMVEGENEDVVNEVVEMVADGLSRCL